jgi:tetratricopeptide (TPR) repeat protein
MSADHRTSLFRVPLLLMLLLLLPITLACGPSDPLQEIREQHAAGEFAESLPALRKIIDRDPSQIEATLMLGRALLRTGAGGLAVWPLRKAAETQEYAVEAGLLLTQAMLESRTAPDAVEEIDRVLAIEPNNLQALVLRVDANRAAHNVEESLIDIERVLELDPSNLPVLVTRVTALIELNRIDEAGTALDEAQASFDDAESKVAHPMLARLCVARALFVFQAGDAETADRHYADCVERFPTERVAVTETISFYDRVGRSERATEILERASAESDSPFFHTLLARRLGALGDSEAEERLLREEAEKRASVPAWFVLADYYVRLDRFDEAILAFEHATAIGPPSPRLRFAYADTLVQAERYDEARQVVSRLQKSELRSLIRGRILLGEGNARGALAAFEAGIRLWPNNSVGRFLAGRAAEGVGDFPRAISHYRESFRTSPGASEAGRYLAELYAFQGLHEDALQLASRYIQGHPRDPEAFLLSIRLAHSSGRHRVVAEGLERLRKMPGQAAVATAEEAKLRATADGTDGAEAAVQVIEAAELDLTDVSNAIVLRLLIKQLVTLDQHEKAVGLADRALSAHPDEAVFHELAGSTRRAAGQTDTARAAYERALELDDQSWRALAGLAAMTADAGDVAEALTLYDRALAARPDDPAPAFAAVALVRDSDPVEAARRLEQLLDDHPRTASAAQELAEILADQGQLDRARNYASRAAWFRLPEADQTLDRIEALRGEAQGTTETAQSGEAQD